jgi:hypothetical protein
MTRAARTQQHVGASELAIHFGMTPRYWTRMAAEGKVPDAWQPSGPGGKWLFDLQAVSRWHRATRKEVKSWPGYTSGDRRIGVAPSAPGKTTDSPSAPRIAALLKSVSGNG